MNLDVISWLGVWFVKSEMYEKAIEFFERAAEIQPTEVKWRLMVTSCHRRMGNYDRALELYEEIHRQHPDNLECLRYLVAICKDLNRECEEYEQKLVRLERTVSQQGASTMMASRAVAQPPPRQMPVRSKSPAAPAPSPTVSDDEPRQYDSPEKMAAPATLPRQQRPAAAPQHAGALSLLCQCCSRCSQLSLVQRSMRMTLQMRIWTIY